MKLLDIKLEPGQKWVEWPKPCWWGGPKLVPFNQLPETSVGELVAEMLRSSEPGDADPMPRPFLVSGSLCMNCGERRLEVSENGGYCDGCS